MHLLLVDLFPPGPHDPSGMHGAVLRLQRYFEELTEHARRCFDAGLSPMDAACEAKLDVADGWSESERLVVNITALYRDFGGDPPSDIATVFGQMAELAGYG